jgi:CBS domain-containing protein
MTVGTVCNREVVFAGKDASISELAQLMREYHVGDVVVVEEKNGKRLPVGIVTDRDLVIEILAKGVSMETVSAGDIMSSELVTVYEDEGLWLTVQRMRVKAIRRLPVVSPDGALVGILTFDDVIDLLASELHEMARIVAREQEHERETRK